MELTATLRQADLATTRGPEQDTLSLLSSLRDSASSASVREQLDELEQRISSFAQFKQNALYHRRLIEQDLDCIIPEYKRSERCLASAIARLYRQDQLAALRMTPEEMTRNAARKARIQAEISAIK